MTVSAASFVQSYPEFSNTTTFPVSSINYWIAIAGLMLTNTVRWGLGSATASSPPTTRLDFATELFVAHNLSLEAQATPSAAALAAGATPGLTPGILSSKSVGPVSAGYDTSAGINPDDGQWNLTIYGIRFIRLAKASALGPIQV
jgi:hypothetical protein